MTCDAFGPLISRYVDDDLDGEDLQRLVAHLGACEGCRSELRSQQCLQASLHTADALDRLPESSLEAGLERILGALRSEAGPVPQGAGAKAPHASDTGRNRRSGREHVSIGARALAFLQGAFLQDRWRFAAVLVAAALIGLWADFREPGDEWVDVRELAPAGSPATLAAVDDSRDPDLDLYVMQHAEHQPWAEFGSDLPVVRHASAASR